MTHPAREVTRRLTTRGFGLRPTLCIALTVVPWCLMAAPSRAQTGVRAPAPSAAKGPPIADLRIRVEEIATSRELEPIAPGGRLVVEPGQTVRLRMAAIEPSGTRHYPSTRFELDRSRGLRLVRNNEKNGSAVLEGLTGGASATLRYMILEPLRLEGARLSGTVVVAVEVPRTPPPSRRGGVTLYEHQNYRGRSERFEADDRSLRDNYSLREDMTSSLRLDPQCVVTLYEHDDYRGAAHEIRQDMPNLDRSSVGNDRVSSLRLVCSRGSATLYTGDEFSGDSETFYEDQPRLSTSRLGQDTASSIRVEPGCVVTLYEEENYGGRATAVDRDLASLLGSRVGDDRASSLRIECPESR